MSERWQTLSYDIIYNILSHYIDLLIDDLFSKYVDCRCGIFDTPCDNCYADGLWPITMLRQIVRLQESLPDFHIEHLFRQSIKARERHGSGLPGFENLHWTIRKHDSSVPRLDVLENIAVAILMTNTSEYICEYAFDIAEEL